MFLFKKLWTKPIIKPSIVPQNIANFSTRVKTLKDDIFTISLVGRPNVGKSSMFNKLAGGKFALTDSLPGLTRDRKEIVTKLFDVPVRLVDTAGWEDFKNVKDAEIKRKMMEQTAQGLIYSDLALFMFDAKNGITSEDIMLANWLRKRQMEKAELDSKVFPKMETLDDVRIRKILLVGNKVENSTELDIYGDVYKLGFGEPILVSAEHGDNMHELWDAIRNEIPDKNREEYAKKVKRRRQKHNEIKDLYRRELLELQENSENPHEINIREWEKEFDMFNKNPEENSDLDSDNDVDAKEALGTNFVNTSGGISADNFMKKKPIQITFAGRPNVGKSTLINSLLKENRIIADDLPGTTRDAISVQWVYKGKKVNLIDTAGLNKKAKLHSKVEQMMKTESIKAIQYSNIVVCVIDALDAFRIQDMSIAQYVIKEGRGIVIVVNKWDLVTQEWRTKASKFMYKQLERFLGETKNIPLYFVSGLTNYKTEEVMDAVLKTYECWNLRVSTGLLNDWLNRFKKTQDLPSENGESLKIRFITQIKSRPPTFSVFVNNRRLFKDNYLKYMKNSLTTEFGIQGVPVRFYIRDSGYKQEKRQIERIKKVGKIKNFFLRKRRLARHARMRLERLGRQSKSE